MRLNCQKNDVESTRKGWSSSIQVLVCTARFWNHQNDKKFGPVLKKLQALYTERCIWDCTNMWHKNLSRFLCCYMPYLEYESIWRAMLFREHFLSDVLPHLHNTMITPTNYFFLSSQNSTLSLIHLDLDHEAASSTIYWLMRDRRVLIHSTQTIVAFGGVVV